MVRPRTGDFVYSEEEVNVMLQDISVFKEYGVRGVVFGALTVAGDIDETLVRKWVPTPSRKEDVKFDTDLFQRQYPSKVNLTLLCCCSRLSLEYSLFPSRI